MKTSSSIIKFLMLSSFLVIGLASQVSQIQAKPILTEMVVYQNSWIPFVQLKEVSISAMDSKKSVLCEMALVNNKLTPSVQLAEITITPKGNYLSIQPANKFNSDLVLVQNKRINGKYMPHICLNEVTISGNFPLAQKNSIANASVTENQGVIQVSVRKSFDRLSGFLIAQGKNALHKMIPSWFAE